MSSPPLARSAADVTAQAARPRAACVQRRGPCMGAAPPPVPAREAVRAPVPTPVCPCLCSQSASPVSVLTFRLSQRGLLPQPQCAVPCRLTAADRRARACFPLPSCLCRLPDPERGVHIWRADERREPGAVGRAGQHRVEGAGLLLRRRAGYDATHAELDMTRRRAARASQATSIVLPGGVPARMAGPRAPLQGRTALPRTRR